VKRLNIIKNSEFNTMSHSPESKNDTKITAETVLHVAKLARLALTEAEVQKFTQDLSNIVGLFDQLKTLDMEALDETETHLPTITREDISYQWADHHKVMALAPSEEDGFYQVPKILES
jgi:aspartyl-tRNA(Asn)/glutamyl-tRNA(Gln) amidotransferase subunit C